MRYSHAIWVDYPCVLCAAVAYCCGAIALRVIAALLGRFLPRLGPLAFASGPFSCPDFTGSFAVGRGICRERSLRAYSAAAANGPRLSRGTPASIIASAAKSATTRWNRSERSRLRSSM